MTILWVTSSAWDGVTRAFGNNEEYDSVHPGEDRRARGTIEQSEGSENAQVTIQSSRAYNLAVGMCKYNTTSSAIIR